MKKKIFTCLTCLSIGILSAFSAFSEDEIRFKLSAENPENNTAEVVLVCDRNPGISEGEFNILYNSSIINLNGYEFKCEGFSTEEFDEEGRLNVKFEKSEDDLSAGGKICSLFFNINNSNENLAGVTIEFVSLKDNDGNELSRLVESCDISIPDGIEEDTQDDLNDSASSEDEKTDDKNGEETEESIDNSSESSEISTENSTDEKEAFSTSVEDENNTAEIVLLILGGIMIVFGASVLLVNLKQKKKK